MPGIKTLKELAFLHDLYIATDWGERFADVVDEHVTLPEASRALYAGAGTGEHALAVQQRAGEKLRFVCVDESNERLELARAKAAIANNKNAEFQREELDALSFSDDSFDLVLSDTSLAAPSRVKAIVDELVRVARPGATVAWWLPTASSFGEFFSIFWEATQRAGLDDQSAEVERLIAELPTTSELEVTAESAGLENVESWTAREEFEYESAEQFLTSPMIADFLLPNWLVGVPKTGTARVLKELARVIDEERHDAPFTLSLKATVVSGTRSRQ